MPTGLAQRWNMDFVPDQLANGCPFRVFTVVDQWSCQGPILEVGFRLNDGTVAAARDRELRQGYVYHVQSRDRVVSSSISRGRASPPITTTSSHSTASCGTSV